MAGAVRIAPMKPDSAVEAYDHAFGIPQAFLAIRLRCGATANLFVGREVFARVGYFDQQLRSGGDKQLIVPHSVVYEDGVKSALRLEQ